MTTPATHPKLQQRLAELEAERKRLLSLQDFDEDAHKTKISDAKKVVTALQKELAEYRRLTGAKSSGGKSTVAKASNPKPTASQLKTLIEAEAGKTLKIRAAGYDTEHIKALAEKHPEQFVYMKGTWPKVKLAK